MAFDFHPRPICLAAIVNANLLACLRIDETIAEPRGQSRRRIDLASDILLIDNIKELAPASPVIAWIGTELWLPVIAFAIGQRLGAGLCARGFIMLCRWRYRRA
jgi:hypothetical protein